MAIAESIVGVAGTVLNKFVADKDLKAKLEHELKTAYHFVLSPILAFVLVLAGVDTPMPEFEFSQLSTILMGMLGLGGLRSYEKMKGVHRNK
jgi:flagellar biosynthesis component FlhA